MRADALGFWWEDKPAEKKVAAEKIKRVAPEPVWLSEDYLPGLDEAKSFPIALMTDDELMIAHAVKDRFLYDIEVYPNYFCAVFRSLATGKAIVFEMTDFEVRGSWDKYSWIVRNITLVTFNGINYDIPITALALDGLECDQLKEASDLIIVQQTRPKDVLKHFRVKSLTVDHIDLIEVAPLQAGLKTYGGRLHVPRMQDLPFHPGTALTPDQQKIVLWYCVNDTTSTAFLHQCLADQITLRYDITDQYGIDVRSKSDAQIAESIIGTEYQRLTGSRAKRPQIAPSTVYHYERPRGLAFQTAYMQGLLQLIQSLPFVVGDDGYVSMPKELETFLIEIGNSKYQMGIGGLHSTEKSVAHHSDEDYQLIDADVTSYYPYIILNNGYYPEHLGRVFLTIFAAIVARRVQAKRDGLKAIANALKIVINGTFGKLGSLWSIMYAPKLMFHVTISGQLYLLMLVEALELAGINVVSGNTDGIMIKCPRHLMTTLEEIVQWWQRETGLELETKKYKSLYSRDINNYIAIPEKGAVKMKGAYSNPWSAQSDDPAEKRLHKNPVTTICVEAVVQYLLDRTPLIDTIKTCTDIRKFTRMQAVTGGAVKDGEFLGKTVRWYYAKDIGGEIVYAKNGHKVGRSEGAKPCLQLPEQFPDDIDYDWYVAEGEKMLKKLAALD